jgi:hypothetical protein
MSNLNNSDIEKSTDLFPKKTYGLAVYSLISAVGSISFTIICYLMMFYVNIRILEGFFILAVAAFSVLAFVLGLVAIVIIHINRKILKGDWYALSAIFLSLPFIFIIASGLFVNANRAKQKKFLDGQLIGNAIIKYATDHNGYLPDANQWCDLLIEYEKKLPEDRFRYNSNESRFKYQSSKNCICNYAFNKNLSGAKLSEIHYNTVIVFESKGKWNLNGTEELFEKTQKKRQYVYVFIKGAEIGHDFPAGIHKEDSVYENVIWNLSDNK